MFINTHYKFIFVLILHKKFRVLEAHYKVTASNLFSLFLSYLNIDADRKDGLDAVYFFLSW